MDWLADNWLAVSAIASGAVNLFCAIAALTKSPKDDKVAAWFKNVLKRFLSIQ